MSKWLDHEVEILVRHYPSNTCKEVALLLNKTPSQVYNKAHSLRGKKTEEFFSSSKSGRLDGIKGKSCRFSKGHVTWNKGMKGLDIGGKDTRFKKGNLPKNHKPVGSKRTCKKDGYVSIKVAEPSTWRLEHVYNWERINGELPKGHCLIFKDGNKLNTSLENLELINRSENMKRNSIHRYPKEIVSTLRVVGALKRRINNEQQHQHA